MLMPRPEAEGRLWQVAWHGKRSMAWPVRIGEIAVSLDWIGVWDAN